MTPRATMIVVPLAVLGVSRLGAEVFVRLYPLRYAWIPSLIVYYLAIEAAVVWVRRAVPDARQGRSLRSRARPARRRLIYGVVIPALLPLGFFILNVRMVPLAVLGLIVVFAPINAYFEEVFWRGLMSYLPATDRVRILWSGSLFAFSHWFFMGAHWLSRPRVLIPVVITTFLMGIAWMWFYLKERALAYTIASHCVVDVLNLSVAVFMGLRLKTV